MTGMEQERTWPLPLAGSTELEISCGTIPVYLQPVAGDELPSLTVSGRDAAQVHVDVNSSAERVRVRLAIPHRTIANLIAGDTRAIVRVPAAVSARVRAEAGAVEARDLDGCRLDLAADAGRVALDNVHGRLTLAADAGQVHGERVGGSLDVRTDAGAVRLHIDQLGPGEHRVRTDVGSVKLELAPGIAVRIETRSGMGSARSSYPSTPDAPAVLRVSTDVGSVRVRPAGEHPADGPAEPAWDPAMFGRGRGMPVPPMPPMPPFPPGMFTHRRQSRPQAPPPPRPPRPEDGEIARVLRMVETGELSAADAEELIKALNHE